MATKSSMRQKRGLKIAVRALYRVQTLWPWQRETQLSWYFISSHLIQAQCITTTFHKINKLIYEFVDLCAIKIKFYFFCIQSGGPMYDLPKGRKDGSRSQIMDTINLPFATFNASQLIKAFSKHGLSAQEMVALSGNVLNYPSLISG